MIANHLSLSGKVHRAPLHQVSPSGIPHCQLMMKHSSIREEAGFYRKVWCQMLVIISGYENQSVTHRIKVGSSITVQGFICYHEVKNGLNKIALHAEKIMLIDYFGD